MNIFVKNQLKNSLVEILRTNYHMPTYLPNNLETGRLVSKTDFRSKLILRAVEETNKLRIIYDEVCLKYYIILCIDLKKF